MRTVPTVPWVECLPCKCKFESPDQRRTDVEVHASVISAACGELGGGKDPQQLMGQLIFCSKPDTVSQRVGDEDKHPMYSLTL